MLKVRNELNVEPGTLSILSPSLLQAHDLIGTVS